MRLFRLQFDVRQTYDISKRYCTASILLRVVRVLLTPSTYLNQFIPSLGLDVVFGFEQNEQ